MAEPKTFFSVIIPTCGRPNELRRCLELLSAQSMQRDLFEIVVSDDRASPENDLRATFPDVRWLAGPGRGPAANRNCGANAARGSWLAFLDDDCLPDAGWLDAYRTAAAEQPDAHVLEGRTFADRPKASLCEIAPVNEDGGRLWSCNFAIERKLFRELGGFDERFPYAAMEDMDLARRISAAGVTPHFVAGASVCHPWRRVKGWAPFRRQIESTMLYLELHPAERKFLNPSHYARVIVRRFAEGTIPALFRGDFAGFTYQLYDHLHSLCMIERLLFKRTNNARPHHSGAPSGN